MFTYDEVLATLNAVVEEKGEDYVYPNLPGSDDYNDWHGPQGECVYSLPDGTPACIVGHVLFRLDPELLPANIVIANAAGVTPSDRFGADEKDYDKIVSLLENAQNEQDTGTAWGIARDAAVKAVERYHRN